MTPKNARPKIPGKRSRICLIRLGALGYAAALGVSDALLDCVAQDLAILHTRKCGKGVLPHCVSLEPATGTSLHHINSSAGGILSSLAARAARASDQQALIR